MGGAGEKDREVQTPDPGRSDVSIQVQSQHFSQRLGRRNSLLLMERAEFFVLFRLSTGWMKPTQ